MLTYLTLCMLFVFSGSALAYIDPASTSYVIQIVAAVFAAGGAAIGIYWKKIQLFLRKRKQKKLDAQRSAELKAESAAKAAQEVAPAAEAAAPSAEDAQA